MSAQPPPPPYIMLGADGNVHPPPYRRNVPRYHHKKSRGSCCFRCICCCYCCLFLLVVILSIFAFYFFAVYKPQVPSYKVDGLQVKSFDVDKDFTLNTEFLVTVKAENPNSHIGLTYGEDNYVMVMYNGSNICDGKLPNFHQGHKNTTFIQVDLHGKSQFGSGLYEALQESQKQHRIPLLVRVKVPVTVVVAEIPLKQFKVFVNCSLVLDSLSPNKPIRIISSEEPKFEFKF